MRHEEEGHGSSVRGRLSEVFMAALAGDSCEALLKRLGDRAAIDEPIAGASHGPAAVRAHVEKLAAWCSEHEVRYTKGATIIGTTVDVTEGTFDLKGLVLPIAVVTERRREREVALRVHFAAKRAGVERKGPTLAVPGELVVPSVIGDAIGALSGTSQKVACFEEQARAIDGIGVDRPIAQLSPGKAPLVPTSFADDGRVAVVEVIHGGLAGLVVLERGESGLVKSVRLYWDD